MQRLDRGARPYLDSSSVSRVAVGTVQEGRAAREEAGKAGQSQLQKGLECKSKMFCLIAVLGAGKNVKQKNTASTSSVFKKDLAFSLKVN